MLKQKARLVGHFIWTIIFGLIAWSGHQHEDWKLVPLLIYCLAFGIVMSMLFHRVQATITRKLVSLKLETINPRPASFYRTLDFAGSTMFLTLLNYFVYTRYDSIKRIGLSILIGTTSALLLAFYKQAVRRRRKARLKKEPQHRRSTFS